jgi:hypothetical protein
MISGTAALLLFLYRICDLQPTEHHLEDTAYSLMLYYKIPHKFRTISNNVLKRELSLHAKRSHPRQITPFSWTDRNVCAFESV